MESVWKKEKQQNPLNTADTPVHPRLDWPHSKDFVLFPVSRHSPYSRDFVVCPVSRHFWTDVGPGPLRAECRRREVWCEKFTRRLAWAKFFSKFTKKTKAKNPNVCDCASFHSFSLFGGRVLPVWKGVGCRWWKITLISGENWPAAAADCTRADGWKIKTLVSRSTTLQPSPRPYFLEKVMEQGCINSAQKWKHGNRRWDAHHS